MNTPITVMVVDDHPMARAGMVRMLNAFEDRFRIVAEARNVEEAVLMARSSRPEVVLTDLHFAAGDKSDGLDLIELLQQQQPDTKAVMVTSERNELFMLKAHDAGALAYLSKDATASEIAKAIEAVAEGFTHFPASLKAALDKRAQAPRLTAREGEIIPYIAWGMTAKDISRELTHIRPDHPVEHRTVEAHKSNIKRKLHLDSANALTAFSIEYCNEHRIDYRGMTVHTKQ
jgi:two-component system, NarL family, nitrate/nitrite response regulator NarL